MRVAQSIFRFAFPLLFTIVIVAGLAFLFEYMQADHPSRFALLASAVVDVVSVERRAPEVGGQWWLAIGQGAELVAIGTAGLVTLRQVFARNLPSSSREHSHVE